MAEGYVPHKDTYKLSWDNGRKVVTNWVRKLSPTSYMVLRKDGSPLELKVKGGLSQKMLVLAKEDIKKLQPAVMNKQYAELEVKKKLSFTQKALGGFRFSGGGSPSAEQPVGGRIVPKLYRKPKKLQ